MKVIVSKSNLEAFLNGKTKTLRRYDEAELHHEFGDYPEMWVTEVEIVVKEIAQGQPQS